MGSLRYRKTAIALAAMLGAGTIGCMAENLEVHTSGAVTVYALPARPNVPGNRSVAVLPPGVTLPVRREVLEKDLAAYEIETKDANGATTRGFVLLGTNGLQVMRTHQ